MSWAVSAAGKPAEVNTKLDAALELQKKYATGSTLDVIRNLNDAAKIIISVLDADRTIVVEHSGHFDALHGSASFTVKTYA